MMYGNLLWLYIMELPFSGKVKWDETKYNSSDQQANSCPTVVQREGGMMESKGFCPIKAQQNYVAHLSRMPYLTLQDDIFFVGCDVI